MRRGVGVKGLKAKQAQAAKAQDMGQKMQENNLN
jgi:hypothetical protein